MSDTNGLNLPSNQNRTGQGTAVEQSRAAAEVHAAILVAQQAPRDTSRALSTMEESCRQYELAKLAFFRFPRAGQNVTGPSVHLARELARCWGNIQYGVQELRRDDEYGQSEMQAFAWDVETNARTSTVFIVPHKRDKRAKSGESEPERLVDMRDIYENNANAGARRVRECVFNVLPPWFVERAKDLCNNTIERGDSDTPLPRRITQAVDMFDQLGVKQDQLEGKLGRASTGWTAQDVAQLGIIYQSIQRGETTRDAEFAPARVTAAELVGQQQPAAGEAAEDPAEPAQDEPVSAGDSAETTEGNGYREDDPDLFAHQEQQ